ncbi:MAG: SDR family oxidoreductase [Dehalococcoidales bacterium]|nr:SDR family oxidoreductase [Dehalococcoidales bacterium]
MSLEGKVAIVTGAGRGLGRAIARGLAAAGADVTIAARTVEQIEETAGIVRELGVKALTVSTNVSDEEQVKNMVDRTVEEFGRVDIMINNAGITSQDRFPDITQKRWNLIMSVNVNGTVLCTQAVLPHMLQQESGVVINVSSILAHRVQYSVVYGVSKAAIERLTQGVAREVRKTPGIAITCIRPYFVTTDVVEGYLASQDTSGWETPEMWEKYTAILAAAEPAEITGKIWDKTALEEKFGVIDA